MPVLSVFGNLASNKAILCYSGGFGFSVLLGWWFWFFCGPFFLADSKYGLTFQVWSGKNSTVLQIKRWPGLYQWPRYANGQ